MTASLLLRNEGHALLWKQFKERNCQRARTQLIEAYAYLCKITASKMVGAWANVDLEDMIGSGYVGLCRAVDAYDVGRGVQFSTYAIALIRGAILEALRQDDWVPRNVREKGKQMARARRAFETEQGRLPSDEELARLLEWTPEELRRAQQLCRQMHLASLSEPVLGYDSDTLHLGDVAVSPSPSPCEQVWKEERVRLLAQEAAALPPRESRVVRLYYGQGKTFKEIGLLLGVSESRAYQLHGSAIKRMRLRMGEDWKVGV